MATLEQAFERFYKKIADHIKESSLHLKAVSSSDGGIYIYDLNGEQKLVGRYFKINCDKTTNDAWVSFLSQTHDEFTLVAHQRGLGWQDMVIWFPKWNSTTWEQICQWFEQEAPPCEWHDFIYYISIPSDAVEYENLGRKFFRDERRRYVYFINNNEVIKRCWDDNLRVLEFCLGQGILPEEIIYTDKTVRRNCLNHWIYKVIGQKNEEYKIIAWRNSDCEILK